MNNPNVHLVASPFFGGPERQLLGLLRHLPEEHPPLVLSFGEHGKSRPLVRALRNEGIEVRELVHNAPRHRLAIREIATELEEARAGVLLCHGYKPDILGYWAARRAGVPVVAISRGWTWATWKVRINEAIDRLHLRWMDRVICVSEGQAAKVGRAGVRRDRIRVIHNAIDVRRFDHVDPNGRDELEALFRRPPRLVVGAIGRLSPEKDFGTFIKAVATVARQITEAGFVIFGDGPLRLELARQIRHLGLDERVVLTGHWDDLDRFMPHLDLVVQSSLTEGLANVMLEALAAGVPVVATAVGGTPEVVLDGVNGYLVPPDSPGDLADRMVALLNDEDLRKALGGNGRYQVARHFTFDAQAEAYVRLFEELSPGAKSGCSADVSLAAAWKSDVLDWTNGR